jgi:hypothetical protein
LWGVKKRRIARALHNLAEMSEGVYELLFWLEGILGALAAVAERQPYPCRLGRKTRGGKARAPGRTTEIVRSVAFENAPPLVGSFFIEDFRMLDFKIFESAKAKG